MKLLQGTDRYKTRRMTELVVKRKPEIFGANFYS
jgi:hypothetical protein